MACNETADPRVAVILFAVANKPPYMAPLGRASGGAPAAGTGRRHPPKKCNCEPVSVSTKTGVTPGPAVLSSLARIGDGLGH